MQYKIDDLSLKIFGNNRIFFETGGAHPQEQSNTNLLESNGWNGVVVEPWEGYNDQYKTYRKNTILENYALVSSDYVGGTIEGTFSSDFGGSVLKGAHGNPWNPSEYPVSTVSKVLKKNNLDEIHLMTIDVEGYEIEVLRGIDFQNVKIHMLVPEHHWGEEFDFLKEFGFEKISVIGNQHVYFNIKSEFFEIAKKYLDLV